MINRVAVQQIIKKVPTELRNLARQERKGLIEASKKDPVGTAFQAAHGQLPFVANNELTKTLNELNVKLAKEACNANFIQRQPMGNMVKPTTAEVIEASSYIG